MAGAIRQIVWWDGGPSNTGVTNQSGHLGPLTGQSGVNNAFCGPAFPLATLSGSTLVCVQVISNQAGNSIVAAADNVNGVYTNLDRVTSAPTGDGAYLTAYFPNAAVVPAGDFGLASSAGSTTTLNDSTKSWTTNQWVGATFTDINSGDTATVTSNTATQLVFSGGIATATANGDPYSVGGVLWTGESAQDDFNAACWMEVTGVTGAPLINHTFQVQTALAAGTNNMSSGAVACGSSPAFVIGIGNDLSQNNSPYTPILGTAPVTWTSAGTGFAWNIGSNQTLVQYANIANPGTMAAQLSSPATNDYMTFLIALATPSLPVITVQPVDQTTTQGSTATFSETDTGGTSWQWYSAPAQSSYPPPAPGLYTNVPGSWTAITGATSNSYTTPAARQSDTGTWFYCAVTNGTGTTNTLPARLWVAGLGPSGRALQ